MIAKPHIAKWQEQAPWKEFGQVEQEHHWHNLKKGDQSKIEFLC